MNLVIYKARRELLCFREGELVLSCPIQLGFGSGDGAKLREGDGRTPEGEYCVSSRNPRSRFFRSLGLSYPNAEDARRGFAAGILTEADRDRILASPNRPPWDTPMGGFLMIHGQPNDGTRVGDWTAGCIAVSNEVMAILYDLTAIGDSVRILP